MSYTGTSPCYAITSRLVQSGRDIRDVPPVIRETFETKDSAVTKFFAHIASDKFGGALEFDYNGLPSVSWADCTDTYIAWAVVDVEESYTLDY